MVISRAGRAVNTAAVDAPALAAIDGKRKRLCYQLGLRPEFIGYCCTNSAGTARHARREKCVDSGWLGELLLTEPHLPHREA